MRNKWYFLFKNIIIGPFLWVYNRPKTTGLENIPTSGPTILASNHQAVMDSFFFPLVCPREITFPAKAEYFTAPGFVGWVQRSFMSALGQIPIDRTSESAGEDLMNTGTEVLKRGDALGIYPEGTRSPDGRVYRGRTGMARIALNTGVAIVPVAMIGSREANPIGSWIPRPKKVYMKIGEPIDPQRFCEERGIAMDDRGAPRQLTDHVMHTLAKMAGKPYVDYYASDVKASLEAGHGYPEGAEPWRD